MPYAKYMGDFIHYRGEAYPRSIWTIDSESGGVKKRQTRYNPKKRGAIKRHKRKEGEDSLQARALRYFLERPDDSPVTVAKKWDREGAVTSFYTARKKARLQLQAQGLWEGEIGGKPLEKPRKSPKANNVMSDQPLELTPEMQEASPTSRQVGGEHYTDMPIQPWDVITKTFPPEQALGYYRGTALSYLMRAGKKGALIEDMEKAHHVLEQVVHAARAEKGNQ